MPIERNVPPPDELTPSELVLLFGDQFARSQIIQTGFMARVKAEYRFFADKGSWSLIGAVFSVFSVPWLMQELSKKPIDWSAVAMAGILVAVGIASVFRGWSAIQARRKATAADFAPEAPEGTTRLLDLNRFAERRELATRIVTASILANEKAGAMTICETEDGIVLTPTGRAISWPRGTIEGRLIGQWAASVTALVHGWLWWDSLDPFERVMNIARIGATVHGYAGKAEAFRASLSPAPVKTLFESCRFLTRLLDEVRAGISSRTHVYTVTRYQQTPTGDIPVDDFREPSAWELEAPIDREDEAAISGKGSSGSWILGSVVVVLGLFLVVVESGNKNAAAGGTALVVISILLAVPYARYRGEPIAKRILMPILWGEIVSLFVFFAWESWVTAFFLAFVLFVVGAFVVEVLKKNAQQRIQERVIEIDDTQQTPTPQQPVTVVASGAVPAPPLTIIDPETLPEVSTDMSFTLPPRLLLLRVFGSPAIEDLLELTKPWEEFGVITHLAGPGTAGENLRDMLNVAIGRVDAAITENDQELDKAFARIGVLRKGRDSIQCTGATWKKAIDRMLAEASAVLMDLSSMSRAHQGCAYELGLLLNRLPLGRVTLLVNDDTDIDSLREILERAWLQIDERSPNRNESGLTWRAIRVGGLAARRPDENVYEWERRSRHRLQPSQLIGFLMNSAMSQPDTTGVALRHPPFSTATPPV